MKGRYEIPTDIYEKVHETMLSIVNANQADDTILSSALYEELHRFCNDQTNAGYGSGFLWEALADVTGDEGARVEFYERALAFARHNSEPAHSILLALGQIHAQAGHWSRAKPLLVAARSEAIENDDVETEGEAASLLLTRDG